MYYLLGSRCECALPENVLLPSLCHALGSRTLARTTAAPAEVWTTLGVTRTQKSSGKSSQQSSRRWMDIIDTMGADTVVQARTRLIWFAMFPSPALGLIGLSSSNGACRHMEAELQGGSCAPKLGKFVPE